MAIVESALSSDWLAWCERASAFVVDGGDLWLYTPREQVSSRLYACSGGLSLSVLLESSEFADVVAGTELVDETADLVRPAGGIERYFAVDGVLADVDQMTLLTARILASNADDWRVLALFPSPFPVPLGVVDFASELLTVAGLLYADVEQEVFQNRYGKWSAELTSLTSQAAICLAFDGDRCSDGSDTLDLLASGLRPWEEDILLTYGFESYGPHRMRRQVLPPSLACMSLLTVMRTLGLASFDATSLKCDGADLPRTVGHLTGRGAEPLSRLVRTTADAEAVAAEWMRFMGFGDAVATPPGRDGGVDVWAGRAVAQVKMEGLPVGRPAVQALFGVASAEGRRGLFFALAGFSTQAREWADRVDMALFSFDFQGRPTAENQTAQRLLGR